jgi:hypothetical protein
VGHKKVKKKKKKYSLEKKKQVSDCFWRGKGEEENPI